MGTGSASPLGLNNLGFNSHEDQVREAGDFRTTGPALRVKTPAGSLGPPGLIPNFRRRIMDFWMLLAGIIFGFLGIYIFRKTFKKIVIREYESGMLYKNGKFKKLLGAGRFWINGWSTEITRVDSRLKTETIPGQEVLTQDQVGLKVSIGIQYQIENPEKALHISESYYSDLYQTAQLALRSIVGNQKIEELLENRSAIGTALLEMVVPDAEKIGLKIHRIDVKDIMFPGDLKKIFAEEVKARKESQAAVERARGESASLRNLANAAKMLENNPALMDLRVLQALSSSGDNGGNIFITRLPRGMGKKDNSSSDS